MAGVKKYVYTFLCGKNRKYRNVLPWFVFGVGCRRAKIFPSGARLVMAYAPQTIKDLKPLHTILADGAEAMRKLMELMESEEIESVELQARELKKRLIRHVEPATKQITDLMAKIASGNAKGLEYLKSRKK